MKKYLNCFPHEKKGDYAIVPPCEYFPKGAIFITCAGHIVELKKFEELNPNLAKWKTEDLPFIPERFEWKVSPQKARFFQTLKTFVHDPKIDSTIIATDPAREGEAIAMLPLILAGNKKPIQRLWCSSLTPAAIRKAFLHLKDGSETYPLFEAAYSRSVADYVIGLNSSRIFTLLINRSLHSNSNGGNSDVFSIGRVQTPLLKVLYDREKAIEQFVSTPYYEVFADFNMDGNLYRGKCFNETTDRLEKKEDAQKIVQFCKGKEAYVHSLKQEHKNEPAPLFFSLNSIQQEANRLYKLSPKRVLSILQGLYEAGRTSYPRTLYIKKYMDIYYRFVG